MKTSLKQYKSTPRNKIIASICKDMQLIEKYGSGIGRVRDHFKAEGLPEPDFENISEGFQVTAYGDEFFNDVGIEEEKTTEKILELITDNPHISQSKIAEIVGITTDGVYWNIKQLKEQGLIERIDGRKQGHWKVITNK